MLLVASTVAGTGLLVQPVTACDKIQHGCILDCSTNKVCLANTYTLHMVIAGTKVVGSMTGAYDTTGPTPVFSPSATGAVWFTFTDNDNNNQTDPIVDFVVQVAPVAGVIWQTPTSQSVRFDADRGIASLSFGFTFSGSASGSLMSAFTFAATSGSTNDSGSAEFPMRVQSASGGDIRIPYVAVGLVVGALGLAALASKRRR